MSQFRLTQISDTHLTRRHTQVIENFHRVCEHIDATRPDLVVNTGDLAYDAPTNPKDLPLAKSLHEAIPVPCRYIPGNHDIGDNPVATGPARQRLFEMFGKVDLRLIASGHVHQRRDFSYRRVRHIWAPSTAFTFSDARQERIALKEAGLVEYRFAPDSFEVRHVRASGQTDIDFDALLKR